MFRNTGLALVDVQAMFNASPNPYVVMDRHLVIVGANQAYLQVTGRTAADLVGQGLFEAFPSPPDAPHGQQLRQSLARVLATGQSDHLATIRYPITGPDGQMDEHVWSATHIPVAGQDGQVTHILQHTENITHLERLRAQARANDPTLAANILRRAEASQATILSLSNQLRTLRGIFEQAPGFAVLLLGPEHRFELVNSAYTELVGARPLIGLTVRQALPELADQGFFDLLDQVYASGQAHVGRGARVNLRTRADGPMEERHVDFVFQPIRQADGQVQGIFVQGHDLTAQVAAQRRADTSQRRFATLAHTLPLHVWTARADGRIDWCNDQVLDYLGCDLPTALATDWSDVLHPDDRAPTREAWTGSLREGGTYLNEFRLRRHDGTYRWHLSRATAVRDSEGRITQWVGSNTDIHDQKASAALMADLNNVLTRRVEERTAELVRTQEALRHSQQLEAMGSLTGGIAHEFNNLLQVIGGNLQLVLQEPDAQARYADRLGRAQTAVARGADLSRQLLAYGRRQPLQPKALRLHGLLQGLAELLRRTLGAGVAVRTALADDLWPTLVDPIQLEAALLNLALNARDAMDGGGNLDINASNAVLEAGQARSGDPIEAGDYVQIVVRDTGHGMSPDVQARAFEPFFTTKPRGKGSGLGLSMVFGFARQTGGHLRLVSAVGHGTAIHLYLPRCADAAVAQATSAAHGTFPETDSIRSPRDPRHEPETGRATAPSATARPFRVLVVEDDEAVRATVVGLLQQLGHAVHTARDGTCALQVLAGDAPIDLLFTDVMMPGPVSPTELVDRARQLRPGLRVLFTSGYAQNALHQGGRIGPEVQLLSKPYTQQALQRKLAHVMARDAWHTATVPHVLLCEDDALVRDTVVASMGGMDCTIVGCATLAEAQAALIQRLPDLLVTDLELPDGSGLTLAQAARARAPHMLIALASGQGGREAAAQVADAVHLDKPFGLSELEDLLAQAAARLLSGPAGPDSQ